MYNFIDVTEVSDGFVLPSEAMKLNGEYLENLIDGYRTLHVSGREALSPEIETYETGVRDGSKRKSRRYPARTIIVTYQLITKSTEAFRRAYNKLGGLLDVEDAELIFNDEPDKFFIGTPSAVGGVEPGSNSVVGEIEILCTDPFKYSVIEYEATAALDESSVLLDYNGTYKSFPTLEADFYSEDDDALTGNGDCGYVAFFNETGKIIQLGTPGEVDSVEEYAESQTLINQFFDTISSWGSAAQSKWKMNSGNILPFGISQTGTVGMGASSYGSAQTAVNTSGTLLNATSTASEPAINYSVTAQTSARTSSTVKVSVAVTAALAKDSNYFGNGYGLDVAIYMGGAWHGTTLKNTSDYWKGRTGHTVNISFTVSGLSETSTSLTSIKFKATRTDSLGAAGTLGETNCNNLAIKQYTENVANAYYLHPTSYGTDNGKWHGPSITRYIPADASGVVGAKNFLLSCIQKVCIGKSANDTNQLGGYHIHLSDASGIVVAGMRVVKNKAGKSASLMLFVDGAKVDQVGIDLSYGNDFFWDDRSYIRKTGNEIVFNIGGLYRYVHVVDDSVAEMTVTKITVMFEQYGTNTPLSYNGISYLKFVKDNCDTMKDIPNRFSTNDVVEADCKTGTIYLNGVNSPDLGALGNDWEGFYLTPGLNQIGFAYSDWVQDSYAPKVKVRYREVFL